MKNFVLFIFCFVLALVATSCKPKQLGEPTKSGFFLKRHTTNASGSKLTFGRSFKMHVTTMMGDSVMQTSFAGAPIEQTFPDSVQYADAKNIPPVYEALLMMNEGDSVTVYQMVDSTIEKYLPEKFKGKVKHIDYVVKLVSVETPEMAAAKVAASLAKEQPLRTSLADFKAGKLSSVLKTTKNNVKVHLLEAGTGAVVKAGEQVSVDYIGVLTSDGTKFDESFKRGQPLTFAAAAGQMIPGFDEAVQTLTHGSKAVIYIPSAQAYGEAGAPPSIPANADIAFYIEIK
jgi:FKBP-type peptidyl-prolyl cis-trans isomerase FkpA